MCCVGCPRVCSLPVSLGPDKDALLAWIRSHKLLADDGRVLSWINPHHPGYPYDEATAIFARLHRWLGDSDRADTLDTTLDRFITHNGGLGRGPAVYVFDSSLALQPDRRTALAQRVSGMLNAGVACDPITRPGWWSDSFGAHLIKSCGHLARVGRRAAAEMIAESLAEACASPDGRFRIHQRSQWTYTHAHCYAVEGLLMLGVRVDLAEAGARWLAETQLADGGFTAWVIGGPGEDRCPADACAQAIRIWALLDRNGYAANIDRALGFLARHQNRVTGGIEYVAGTGDENSWATALTIQALMWLENPPSAADRLQWLL